MPDLITQRLKLKNVYPESIAVIAEEYGIKEDEIEFIRKGLVPSEIKTNREDRTEVSYITTRVKDRDDEIILPEGINLKDFRKHPVVLDSHQYGSIPIGMAMWIKTDDKGLLAKTKYANHQRADDWWNYADDGFPLAKSIGFIPLSFIDKSAFDELDLESMKLKPKDVKEVERIYDKILLLEYSNVPVPSNPEALALAYQKGIIGDTLAKDLGVEIGEKKVGLTTENLGRLAKGGYLAIGEKATEGLKELMGKANVLKGRLKQQGIDDPTFQDIVKEHQKLSESEKKEIPEPTKAQPKELTGERLRELIREEVAGVRNWAVGKVDDKGGT